MGHLTRALVGPYAHAVLRFQMDFPEDYPERPPTVAFLSDVFHPLVTPPTTYTYSTRDTGAETVSAADHDRLPPGGLSLRHGFPEWFGTTTTVAGNNEVYAALQPQEAHDAQSRSEAKSSVRQPLTAEVLQYIRIMFDTEAILDSIPLQAAANTGAWHAWRSYRSKMLSGRSSPTTSQPNNASDSNSECSMSPRQQPGGARRPSEWNWQGVWEDRVKKSVQASNSEYMLYGSDNSDVVCFSKMDQDVIRQLMPSSGQGEVT